MKVTRIRPINVYSVIPVVPSTPFFTMNLTLEGVSYIFRFRWNDSTKAFYFDVLTPDKKVIALGIKIVLGIQLGRFNTDDLFVRGMIVAADLTTQGGEATLDDLGTRVELRRYTREQAINANGFLTLS